MVGQRYVCKRMGKNSAMKITITTCQRDVVQYALLYKVEVGCVLP